MKEALQEVLEGEMTEFLGAKPGERTEARSVYAPPWSIEAIYELSQRQDGVLASPYALAI